MTGYTALETAVDRQHHMDNPPLAVEGCEETQSHRALSSSHSGVGMVPRVITGGSLLGEAG